MLVYNYSLLYYAKKTENGITFLDMNPIFMAKGICNNIGVQYLDEIEKENRLRPVRRRLFKNLESVSVFKVGNKIRVHKFESYEITHVKKTKDGDVLVTAKPIGSHFGEPEKLFLRKNYIIKFAYSVLLTKIIRSMCEEIFSFFLAITM